MASAPTPSGLDRHSGQDLNTIPRYVQFTSPVSLAPTYTNGLPHAQTLPLNLIAHIVSYLDDVADVARVTRTSRLLYYMALPQLYQRVSLHSYPDIRYVNGRPEGYGSGSPFVMALNGLVTKSHAALVKDMRVWGLWREMGMEDFEKGRVPDNNMMLNILLRVATDRMTKLQSFSWELDCRPLKTIYQGLALRESLTSLTLRFSTSRDPRPVVIIPPMANLRAFKALDMDPLCYPDDISLLLLQSKKLEDLRLHFSPRMRAQAESSLNFETYFGRCSRSGYAIPLKHFALQNWYGRNIEDLGDIFDVDRCQSTTFLDVFGGTTGTARTAFVDESWNTSRTKMFSTWRACRTNEMSPVHVYLLGLTKGLERLYFVSAQSPKTGYTPNEIENAPTPSTPTEYSHTVASLGRDYLQVLTQQHGQTLRKLLLSDQWALTADEVGTIVRLCPNLEQLGMALEKSEHAQLRLLVPFLPRLYAVRVLHNEALADRLRNYPKADRMAQLGRDCHVSSGINLRYIGVGKDIYHVGDAREVELPSGERQWQRKVTELSLDDVQHIEIWGYDCLDISKEPMATFSP